MAEGGDGKHDKNPFSFHKFIDKKTKQDSNSNRDGDSGDEVDVFDLVDDVEPKGTERERQNEQFSPGQPRRTDREDENPFSFKKFLQSSHTGGARPKNRADPGLATLDLACDLPDFVQGHVTQPDPDTNRRSHSQRQGLDVPLPDFTLDSNGPLSNSHSSLSNGADNSLHDLSAINNQSDNRNNVRTLDLPLDNLAQDLNLNTRPDGLPDPNLIQDDTSPDDVPHSTGGLPDFLSDNALSTNVNTQNSDSEAARDDISDYTSPVINGDHSSQILQLREENRQLRQQLMETREFSDRESMRVANVLSEMEVLQKREAAETLALENMVQQVEANLAHSTKRAASAEREVARLKLEVQKLQGQLSGKPVDQLGSPVERDPAKDPVKMKAKYASEQIGAAAKTAEASLKQLLSGVETLKLVADVLASIDKVTDQIIPDDYSDMDSASGGASNSS